MKKLIPTRWLTCAVLMLAASGSEAASGVQVAEICREHKIAGGLIVHLGCGDGRETASLRPGESFQVHGLDTDAAKIRQARAHLQTLGVYGDVSVDTFDGSELPYANNMVNVLIAGNNEHRVAREELLRVLVPGGVAIVDGRTITKPWPDDVDHWTHFLHDSSGNAVSTDRRVAPPRHLQWDGGPRWCRSHETDMSVTAVVSANGRIFHTLDEGPIGIHETPLQTRRFPDRCSLVARDAFNGVVLWKRSMPGWGSAAWDDSRWKWGKGDQLWSAPLTLPRRLVAVGDRVYVTLGFRACVSELDALSGKTLREFQEAGHAEEILLSEGVLVLRVREEPKGDAIVAIDVDSGRIMWKKQVGAVADLTLAVSAGRVCFNTAGQVVALDLETGRELWKADLAGRSRRGTAAGTLVMHDDVVLSTASGAVRAFSATDGRLLWEKKVGGSFRGMPDVFVVEGLAWIGTLTTRGLDLRTGEERRQIDAGFLFTDGHHPRCHRAKATTEFLLWSKRGVEFLDLVSDRHMRHDWFRGTCRYGVMPANGLLYAPPHPCFCFPGVKLTGFNALSAGNESLSDRRRRGPHLVEGRAYGSEMSPCRTGGAADRTWWKDGRTAASMGCPKHPRPIGRPTAATTPAAVVPGRGFPPG